MTALQLLELEASESWGDVFETEYVLLVGARRDVRLAATQPDLQPLAQGRRAGQADEAFLVSSEQVRERSAGLTLGGGAATAANLLAVLVSA